MSISRDKPDPNTPKTLGKTGLPGADDPQAKLAHELANLLDGSLRNVGLVMSSMRDPATAAPEEDELLRRLDTANKAMQQMATLLQRWMSAAKPVASLHHQASSLHEIVQSAVRLLSPVAAGRGVEIVVDLDEHVANLPAGPIYPVIANAVRNSIEAIAEDKSARSPRARRVQVTARPAGDHVEIRILDDGPGINPAMFDTAGDLRPGVTTKQTGHGLGLGVSRDIMRSLDGSIDLTNRRPRGAELVIRYPILSVLKEML